MSLRKNETDTKMSVFLFIFVSNLNFMRKKKSILETIEKLKAKRARKIIDALEDLKTELNGFENLKTQSVRNQEYENAARYRNLELEVVSKIDRITSYIRKSKKTIKETNE